MTLLDLALHHPDALPRVLAATPIWVWALLAGLVALGLSQTRNRVASLPRVLVMPIAMTGFAIFGIASAFGASPRFGETLTLWWIAAAALAALVVRVPVEARWIADRREFRIVGSWVPLALILAVFAVKWGVGVEMALDPRAAWDAGFAWTVGTLYGAATGLFVGRALRLVRLAIAGSDGFDPLAA